MPHGLPRFDEQDNDDHGRDQNSLAGVNPPVRGPSSI